MFRKEGGKKKPLSPDYIEKAIYKAAVDEEKIWRKECSRHDVFLMDQLLEQVRSLGYRYRYFADITNRENTDFNLSNLLLKYIGQFRDDYFSAALVGVVGKKGNLSATEVVLKNYRELSEDSKWKYAGFYDNALNRIKDKRYLTDYINLLKNPNDAIKLPLTMIMLGKWQLEEAKIHFLRYLDEKILYHNKNTSDLVYISTEALSYYHDVDGSIKQALEGKLNTNDKDLFKAVQKAIKRIEKNKA